MGWAAPAKESKVDNEAFVFPNDVDNIYIIQVVKQVDSSHLESKHYFVVPNTSTPKRLSR